jgi:hypothetical protein
MNTTSWGLIGLILVAIVIMFPLTPLTTKVAGRFQATPVDKTYPYRPSETMGSNKVSFQGLDTKALCATTDICV